MRMQRIPNSALTVSALCYGVAGFGTTVRGAEMERLYAAFREAGGTFFDTAHCYCFWIPGGLGASERALGDVVRRHGDRQHVVLGTKGGHPAVGAAYPRPDRYLAPAVIAADVGESLERLGVDCIDLYFLHRDDTRVPVGEIVGALDAEIALGRIRCAGASNWTTARIAEANAYAAAHGLHGFVASQPQWNLAQPNLQDRADPTMRFLAEDEWQRHVRSGLPVVPYSPTANGYFATGGQRGAAGFDNDVSRARLRRAEELAARKGCTPNQVALAWLMHQPFPVIPILGTLQYDHLTDALGAVGISLSPCEVQWLHSGAEASTVGDSGEPIEPIAPGGPA